VQNFAFKFQAVAEKTAKKMLGGYFILPHPVQRCDELVKSYDSDCPIFRTQIPYTYSAAPLCITLYGFTWSDQGCGSRDLVLVSRPIKTTFWGLGLGLGLSGLGLGLGGWSWARPEVMCNSNVTCIESRN